VRLGLLGVGPRRLHWRRTGISRCVNGSQVELLDVAVGDTYVVAVQRATASRGKRTLDITGCQLILVSNGAIQTIRGHYSDQTALDAFWVE
jgi:uncharacterized protein